MFASDAPQSEANVGYETLETFRDGDTNPRVLNLSYVRRVPPHHFPRYGYVQAGTIEVTNVDTGKTETFKTGDFIVEAVDQWHFGTNKGPEPVKLLVIDIVEKGQSNTVFQK